MFFQKNKTKCKLRSSSVKSLWKSSGNINGEASSIQAAVRGAESNCYA